MGNNPDFVVFTDDLAPATDDVQVRCRRMAEFNEIVTELKVARVR